MKARFTARIRKVGGNSRGSKREALGLTVPSIVCEDLGLKRYDIIEVTVGKKE